MPLGLEDPLLEISSPSAKGYGSVPGVLDIGFDSQITPLLVIVHRGQEVHQIAGQGLPIEPGIAQHRCW